METISREKTCCFTGHRPGKLPWNNNEDDPRCAGLKQALADVLDALYESGYRRFLCGMAAGSDIYFGEAVLALQKHHPDAVLCAVIPCAGQETRWSAAWRERYHRLLAQCGQSVVLQEEHTANCMMNRNRYMVDHASLLIAVYDGKTGGTRNTLRYAARQNLRILELPTDGFADFAPEN